MCGILGQISYRKTIESEFDKALNLLNHRGPDNHSVKHYHLEKVFVSLGHTRLKIIDLSQNANQPFEIDHCTIVFNGEIYNYESIKKELEDKGIVFKTHSDTEVILQAYLFFGLSETVNKLHGMFAFCIYDKSINKAFLVRDRVGIKPLYYFCDQGELIFASEIKAIQRLCTKKLQVDNSSVANFFYHRHIAEPNTIFQEIKTVNSGEYIEICLNELSVNKKCYWSLNPINKENNEKRILDKIDELLNESVKEHLVSDVPISFALSGGLDSSLLIAMSKNYKKDIVGYTVKRSDNDIDWIYSKKIASYLDVEHRIIEFQSLDMNKEDKKIFEIYDNPIACSSIFGTYLLYKEIAKEFKVCISGDGADELFGGYKWYQSYFDLTKPSLETFLNVDRFKYFIRNYLKYTSYSDIEKYKRIMLDRFSKTKVEKDILNQKIDTFEEDMYKRYIANIVTIKDMMYVDFFTFLRFGLLRADLSSMAHSVENRVPFLDYRIVEYAFSIDPKLFNKKGVLKYLLKKVAERYLPKEYIYRAKRGFSTPVHDILPISNAQNYMEYIFKQWQQCHLDIKKD